MADNKKYYYMRLKEDFFNTEEVALLESLPDGYLYSNILLKLYLISLKHEGRLMFNNTIPYNAQMIATLTRHQIGTVEKALKVYQDMGFIEILDNGAIYMLNIQALIGESSSEADRQRAYRARIEAEKKHTIALNDTQCNESVTNVTSNVGQTYTIDRDIDKDIYKDKKNRGFIPPTVEDVREYCKSRNNTVDPEAFVDWYESNGWMVGKNKMKNWKAAVRTWEKKRKAEKKTKFENFNQRDYDFDELEELLLKKGAE